MVQPAEPGIEALGIALDEGLAALDLELTLREIDPQSRPLLGHDGSLGRAIRRNRLSERAI
jgi:hypothetical protein